MQTTTPFTSWGTISIVALRRLLIEIKELRPDVHIRFRLKGHDWQKNFSNLFIVTETGIVLIDRIDNKVEIVSNFDQIIQFEVDSRFQRYAPYTSYQIGDL
jgi:hypothetical protein